MRSMSCSRCVSIEFSTAPWSETATAPRTAPPPSGEEKKPDAETSPVRETVSRKIFVSHRSQSFFLCPEIGTKDRARMSHVPKGTFSPSTANVRTVKQSPSPCVKRTCAPTPFAWRSFSWSFRKPRASRPFLAPRATGSKPAQSLLPNRHTLGTRHLSSIGTSIVVNHSRCDSYPSRMYTSASSVSQSIFPDASLGRCSRADAFTDGPFTPSKPASRPYPAPLGPKSPPRITTSHPSCSARRSSRAR
mmetsp:Transcript_4509/g.15030  ORF Transcript_4509/g.15030 Transcript_4509/m.15030 type:complete len:247 (+) Transcript_4509:37-777(+)